MNKKAFFILTFSIFTFLNVQGQKQPEKFNGQEVFDVVEKMPFFPGGMDAFNQYITENLQYPESAKNKGISGKVFVQFLIALDGKLYNTTVLKGLGPEFDKEAERVVKASPVWTPAKQGGKTVVVKMILPVVFKL